MKVSSDYRALAREALRGKWKTAVLAGIVASALGANIVNGTGNMASRANQNTQVSPQDALQMLSEPGGRLLAFLGVCIITWTVVTFVVSGMVRLGYARFNLNLADQKEASVSGLFSAKGCLWKGFCMNFWQALYVALWTLLLVIPGIVKSYSYAMTPYILAEHPTLTANEAITESRRIMDGNKWRLFCLDLSFLGWQLLCSVPMVVGFSIIVAASAGSEAMGIALILLLTVPLSAGFFIVRPYNEAAWAVFYRDITTAAENEMGS